MNTNTCGEILEKLKRQAARLQAGALTAQEAALALTETVVLIEACGANLHAVQDAMRKKEEKYQEVQQALRLNEERMRTALKANSLTAFNQDHQLRYTWVVNPVVHSLQAILGRRDSDLLERPQDVATLNAIKTRVLETGQGARTEVEVWLQGAAHFMDLTVEPLHDAEGRVVGITGAFWDLTEIRRIRDENDRLFHLSLDMICVAGFDGFFKRLNPAWTAVLGYSHEELTAKPWIEFVHPDDKQATIDAGRKLVDGSPVEEFENRYRCKDGSFKWLSWKSVPVVGEGRVYAVARDVTEAKHAEQTLREYQARLSTMVVELSLAEERERRALATDVHDALSQTLNLAQIKLGMLEQSRDAAPLAAALREVRRLVQQAEQSARSITFQLSPPALYDLGFVSAAQWLAENMLSLYGLHVTLHDDGQPKPIEERIRVVLFRCLRELLVNAAKHAKTNRASVTLAREGANIVVTVADEGVGFDPAPLHASGRGFGLFSIRERLGHLHGAMDVRSIPGAGTTIRLTAPLRLTVPPSGNESP